MKYLDCFRALARQRTDQIVITSAGNSGQAWWAATRDTEATFYLDASMSLSTMFASGLAFARPELKIWAFMGDGAFCMNPGMLMVERQMNLPNLTHFLVSNRAYGATSNAGLPNVDQNDYAAIARAMGLDRVARQRLAVERLGTFHVGNPQLDIVDAAVVLCLRHDLCPRPRSLDVMPRAAPVTIAVRSPPLGRLLKRVDLRERDGPRIVLGCPGLRQAGPVTESARGAWMPKASPISGVRYIMNFHLTT